MYKLGITGGIGSGKSTTSDFFKDKGALVFDADLEAKKLITNNSTLKKQIISAFGTEITADNQLDLKKLADVVFLTEKHQKSLNDIVWPEVSNVMNDTAKNAENDEAKLFIVDAALLLEAEFNEFFNSILLITADKSVRYKRIQKRKNIPEDQIEKRMALQMPESQKKKLAHSIIENNGDLSELQMKLDVFWGNLNID